MARISVIVPVYQVEPYLKRCVDSILNQTYSDFDLILVDDGSLDRCGDMCDEFALQDSRVHVLHQKNGGLSAARNAGIDWVMANSKSEWITFVDSDDWVRVDYLERLYNGAIKNSVQVAVCGYERVSMDGLANAGGHEKLDYIDMSPEDFLEQCYQWRGKGIFVQNIAPGKLYARICFNNIRFPKGVMAHEDVYTTYKIIFAQERVAFSKESLYFYFQNSHGITGATWSPSRLNTVWGHQQQIEFFEKNGFERALTVAVRQQCNRIAWALSECRKVSLCGSYIPQLESLLRSNFDCYRSRCELSLINCLPAYRELFPVQAHFYPLVRVMDLGFLGVLEKMRERIKRRISR